MDSIQIDGLTVTPVSLRIYEELINIEFAYFGDSEQ